MAKNNIERNKASFLNKNHFCVIWKSQDVSFNKVIKEIKETFKIVDNYITKENANSHFEYIYTLLKKLNHI